MDVIVSPFDHVLPTFRCARMQTSYWPESKGFFCCCCGATWFRKNVFIVVVLIGSKCITVSPLQSHSTSLAPSLIFDCHSSQLFIHKKTVRTKEMKQGLKINVFRMASREKESFNISCKLKAWKDWSLNMAAKEIHSKPRRNIARKHKICSVKKTLIWLWEAFFAPSETDRAFFTVSCGLSHVQF